MNYLEYFRYWQSVAQVGSAEDFLSQNERPIIEALSLSGLQIRSVWTGLTNPRIEDRKPIADRIDLLISFLDQTSIHPRIMGGLVRSLASSQIEKKRNLFADAKARYLSVPPSDSLTVPLCRGLDQAYASLVAEHATNENINELIELLNVKALGESRGLLLLGLKRHISDGSVLTELERFQNDSTFGKEVQHILATQKRNSERRQRARKDKF